MVGAIVAIVVHVHRFEAVHLTVAGRNGFNRRRSRIVNHVLHFDGLQVVVHANTNEERDH